MNLKKIVPALYAFLLGFFPLSLIAKLDHSANFMVYFCCAVGTQILFSIFSIVELRGSEQISESDKGIWSGLLIAAPAIFGFFYIKNLRRKIYLY
jgi:hypothetical protein